MRVLRAAALLTVMLSGPVFAQGAKPPPPSEPPKSYGEIESEKSQDKAYKNSLRNIPDKPAADPWGGAHALDSASSPTSSSGSATPSKRAKSSSSN
jgi:hypothetical protein